MRPLLIAILLAIATIAQSGAETTRRIVGYVTSWDDKLPPADKLTNINYAFGHVTDTFDGVRIDNPSRLKDVVALKDKNRHLQVQLSIGGWGSGNFSEMAADETKRESFARDCRRIVDEYGLDGIDIDWEYPGSGSAGISSSPDDKRNFNLLIIDLRKALGDDKLLTLASPATFGFYDFKPIMPYVDFVNIMAYDLDRPPHHHSSLFRSELSGEMTADEGVRAHISGGVQADKIILGVPFYGHGLRGVLPDFVNYDKIGDLRGYTSSYDDVGCVPYLADSDGRLVLCFDNPKSLKRKCRYVIENSLGGIMFWDYSGDTDSNELLRAIHEGLR